MIHNESKVLLIEDSPYRKPLADTRNIQPRLMQLLALLEQISEKLVESTAAARARGIVETIIRLNLVNFDVMELACTQIEEAMLCNTYPTKNETPCHELIKQAFDLAADIVGDLPLGISLGPNAPSPEEFEAMKARLQANGAAPKPASKKAEEDEPETILSTGKMSAFKRLVTRHNEVMATFILNERLIVVFPRTFQTYRNALELANSTEQPITIKLDTETVVQTFYGAKHHTMREVVVPNPTPFNEGQRVRLIQDLPDKSTDVHPVHHFKGDEGTIYRPYPGCELGFMADRWGDITTFRVEVDGKRQSILDFCEAIEGDDTIPLPVLEDADDEEPEIHDGFEPGYVGDGFTNEYESDYLPGGKFFLSEYADFDEEPLSWEACGNCDNSGKVPDAEPGHYLTCPVCDGSGTVPFWGDNND
jgi:hypothetical protein